MLMRCGLLFRPLLWTLRGAHDDPCNPHTPRSERPLHGLVSGVWIGFVVIFSRVLRSYWVVAKLILGPRSRIFGAESPEPDPKES